MLQEKPGRRDCRAHFRTFKVEEETVTIPNDTEFIEYVREVAEIFHKTIQHSDGVTRFLGNSSFRGEGNLIYVSERDVDKSTIDINHFVAAYTENDKKYYCFPTLSHLLKWYPD